MAGSIEEQFFRKPLGERRRRKRRGAQSDSEETQPGSGQNGEAQAHDLPPHGGETFGGEGHRIWDRELPGFGLRAYATGSKVYVVQTRARGRSKRVTIGRHGVVTAEQARQRAALIIARMKSGEAAVAAPARVLKGPTVAELAERYLKEHVSVRCKASTASRIRLALNNYLLPEFGELPIEAVEPEKVWALRNRLHRTPAMANQVVNTLSAMLTLAETWGMAPEGNNPCPQVTKYKVLRHERFLTEVEFARLGQVLSEAEVQGEVSAHAAAALRLLMLTGCWRNEILRLRWDEVDLERRELRLRDSKTGPRTVPLSPAAARVLANLPRRSGIPWVIPGGIVGQHLKTIDKPWSKVRSRAGLDDVRLHDLRHSFASRALALGESLPVIGKLLGHTQIQTTARYAHLAEDSVKESAARIAASIGEDILKGTSSN